MPCKGPIGCGDDESDDDDDANGSWCAQHATQCPGAWDPTRGECVSFCGTGTPLPSAHEDCKFAYCAVQASLCDNDEPGDPTITACVDQL